MIQYPSRTQSPGPSSYQRFTEKKVAQNVVYPRKFAYVPKSQTSSPYIGRRSETVKPLSILTPNRFKADPESSSPGPSYYSVDRKISMNQYKKINNSSRFQAPKFPELRPSPIEYTVKTIK